MSKILNLDEIETKVDKSFVYKGVTYDMVPLTVGAYIDQLKAIEEMNIQGEGSDPQKTLEFMITSVCQAFPALTPKIARTMTDEMIAKLMEHVQGDVTEEMEQGNES